MVFRHGGLSRRDAFLLLIGASSMHIWSLLFSQPQNVFIDAHPQLDLATVTQIQTQIVTQTATSVIEIDPTPSPLVTNSNDRPDTSILAHAPGWTLFRNLYMSNGTLFLVAEEYQRSKFPEIRKMASHPLEAFNTPANIAAREPSDLDMTFITPEEARTRWGDRVWAVEGNTVSFVYHIIYHLDLTFLF